MYETPRKETHRLEGIGAKDSYRIVLADDHDLFRQDVKRILMKKPEVRIVGEVRDGIELLFMLRTITPQMVILDISMPGMSGLDAALKVSNAYPEIDILILTMHKNAEYLKQSLAAGAKGYLLKDHVLSDLLSSIETIRKGGIYISPLFGS
jgi:DNA-binding NarL/FixJ family response regulator